MAEEIKAEYKRLQDKKRAKNKENIEVDEFEWIQVLLVPMPPLHFHHLAVEQRAGGEQGHWEETPGGALGEAGQEVQGEPFPPDRWDHESKTEFIAVESDVDIL